MIAVFGRRVRSDWHHPVMPVVFFFAVLVFVGAGGLIYFEKEAGKVVSWPDGIWWAVVTMTTVGYGDIVPTSNAARYLVGVPIMVFGIGVLGYLLSVVASRFVDLRTKGVKGVGKLKCNSHMVIMHFQSVGRLTRIIAQLNEDPRTRATPIVLIDRDLSELPHELVDLGVGFVRGDPDVPSTLKRARIESASRALVLAKRRGDPASDLQTIASTVALRTNAPDLYIVAECVEPERAELLTRSGANSTVCAAGIGASLLAQEAADPGTQSVISEIVESSSAQQIFMVDIGSAAEWKFEALHREVIRSGAILMGVHRAGKVVLNPGPEFSLEEGDRAICIGSGHREPLPSPGARE